MQEACSREMKGSFEKQVNFGGGRRLCCYKSVGSVSLWKEKLRWNECRQSSGNECTQKKVQQKKDMTADGQDYRSSLPWEEGKDGEVK